MILETLFGLPLLLFFSFLPPSLSSLPLPFFCIFHECTLTDRVRNFTFLISLIGRMTILSSSFLISLIGRMTKLSSSFLVSLIGLDDNTLIFFSSDNGPWTGLGVNGGSAGAFAKSQSPDIVNIIIPLAFFPLSAIPLTLLYNK